jgi:hypothetical protein
MGKAAYEKDVVAWASEQAALLRAGHFSELDVEHVAEEIEDVGKSEQRDLASRMAVLLAHLLKWAYQPERRGASWRRTIDAQRKEVAYSLSETPSLKTKLGDAAWLDMVWARALAQATVETGLDVYPDICPWPVELALTADFYPG